MFKVLVFCFLGFVVSFGFFFGGGLGFFLISKLVINGETVEDLGLG